MAIDRATLEHLAQLVGLAGGPSDRVDEVHRILAHVARIAEVPARGVPPTVQAPVPGAAPEAGSPEPAPRAPSVPPATLQGLFVERDGTALVVPVPPAGRPPS